MRIWKAGAADDGTVHCLGNGRICAYGLGPNLFQVFGPPYSTPAFHGLELDAQPDWEVRVTREPGTAVYNHTVLTGGSEIAAMTEFADAELPAIVRRIQAYAPLRFVVRFAEKVAALDFSSRFADAAGAALLVAESGRFVYMDYPFPVAIHHAVLWRGDATGRVVEAGENGEGGLIEITCAPGTSELLFVGGPQYPECIEAAEKTAATPFDHMLARTRQDWMVFSRHHASLADGLPDAERLNDAADAVAIAIRTQQGAEGAVLAGYPYHLGYVRDQYGVARGLLALQHNDEARRLLEFYWNVWQRHGMIRNAQGIGADGVFHIHENDDVEITGYLILKTFDYADRSGDSAFVSQVFPMLEWAFEAQKRHLLDGMLPFNGDETYIAGGILPRSALNDGSSEATMLFLDTGERLVEWAENTSRWPGHRIDENRELLAEVRGAFRRNFWRDGRLITNNPERREAGGMPRFRHGVCEASNPMRFGWTERTETGRYMHPAAFAEGLRLPEADATVYTLQSVSLTPLYFASSLLKPEELAPVVDEILSSFERTGALPSRPDTNVSVGYDYGLVLYASAELGNAKGALVYDKMMGVIDAMGTWSEYYLDHQPFNTRCRPWESAINIEAALHWARRSQT